MNNTAMKQCCRCKEEFPATLEYFHTRNSEPDHLNYYCKPCYRAIGRARPHHTPEYCRQYYEANKERIKQRTNEYGKTHREQGNRRTRQKRKTEAGRLKHVTEVRNRRAKIKAALGKHTVADIQAQHERQKGKCFYCKKKLDTGKYAYHVDHVIPLAKGGTNDPSNLVITCPACNLHKNVNLYTLF